MVPRVHTVAAVSALLDDVFSHHEHEFLPHDVTLAATERLLFVFGVREGGGIPKQFKGKTQNVGVRLLPNLVTQLTVPLQNADGRGKCETILYRGTAVYRCA